LRYRAEDLDLWRASQILGLLADHLGFALDVTLKRKIQILFLHFRNPELYFEFTPLTKS
jgi:hypothetical protein